MSIKHTYEVAIRCANCDEELAVYGTHLQPEAGEWNMLLAVDVESLRLSIIRAMAIHEDDCHSMGNYS